MKKLIYALVTAIVVAIGLLAWFFYFPSFRPVQQNSGGPFQAVRGYLYLSLATTSPSITQNLYEFDLTNRQLIKVSADSHNLLSYQGNVSHDNTYLMYSLGLASSTKLNIQTFVRVAATSSPKIQLTNDATPVKRNYRWSPDDSKAVFVGSGTKAPTSAEDLSIYVINNATSTSIQQTKFLVKGIDPAWSPDGTEIIYIGNAGIYGYSFKTGTSTLAFPIPAGITNGMYTAINGSILSLSSPFDKIIQIHTYTVTSWDPLQIQYNAAIHTPNKSPFEVAFSPDGRYLAYDAFSDLSAQQQTAAKSDGIYIYDPTSNQSLKVLDTSSFSPSGVSLLQWGNVDLRTFY